MSAYDVITDRLCTLLDAGTVPWHRPWAVNDVWPTNLTTHKEYRGINVLMLASAGFSTPYFLTFRQAKSIGASVKKGEHGTPVVFWKLDEKDDEQTDEKRRFPILRYYTVFNVAQCDNVDPALLPPVAEPGTGPDPIDAAEDLIAAYQGRGGPVITEGAGQAFYRPSTDTVHLPDMARFESAERFYECVFHEMGHSTGHASRLKRGVEDLALGSRAGHAYGKEELVAELTAAFLCGATGILPAVEQQTAAYLASWAKTLRGDKRLIIQAATAAQKAADYIRHGAAVVQGAERAA